MSVQKSGSQLSPDCRNVTLGVWDTYETGVLTLGKATVAACVGVAKGGDPGIDGDCEEAAPGGVGDTARVCDAS